MSKVLVVRKTDKTIHIVPIENLSRLQSFNNRLPNEQKWIFEEMDAEEASKLPFLDQTYTTGTEAVSKVKSLQAENESKDNLIAELEAKLKALDKQSTAKQNLNPSQEKSDTAETIAPAHEKTVSHQSKK